MGLLEEAIREHLELKRQHGADPGEVAAQERDALGPIQRGVEPAVVQHADEPEPDETAPEDVPAAIDDPAAPLSDEPAADHPSEVEPGESSVELPEGDPEPAPAPDPSAPFDFEDEPFAPEPPRDEEPAAEPDEDVLEETPEFLQETPEHDRLWFEQRPPRDFDFDG
jgi:hypothetical protein